VRQRLRNAKVVLVVNQAHHMGRGHLTLDIADALAQTKIPIDSFFCGLGGADVSAETWRSIVTGVAATAERGFPVRPWTIVHDGVDLEADMNQRIGDAS